MRDKYPTQTSLINAVLLNEAKDSSEIENIITTHDELFVAMAQPVAGSPAAKEVLNYKDALWFGWQTVMQKQAITTNTIVQIQQRIEKNLAGIRKLPGTVLKNDATGAVVYTPPSGEETLLALMSNLERYINDDADNTDPSSSWPSSITSSNPFTPFTTETAEPQGTQCHLPGAQTAFG